ncbi:phospholipase D A-like isoform X1 [Mytilus edulis]|uniref:phospholipase D A-like isoform X1 n=1 Tax=Mytilus edulis TaxID=6550 RepID=UPI0039EE51CF
MTKDRKTGVNVVRRIRSFVFGKKKGINRNNNCNIPSLADTTIKYTPQKNNRQQHQDDIQQQQQQRQDDGQQQQQHEQNENENKKKKESNDTSIPFSLFLKCAKKALSSKKGRQQLFWDTYSHFWHYFFEDAAAEARMAEEEEFDFDSKSYFDDEFY